MDDQTDELRLAHDQLAELYAEKLGDFIDDVPAERAVLDLFCRLLPEQGRGALVGEIGSGSGRVSGYLARHGVQPHGIDLSTEMVRVARRDYPGIPFDVADVRRLPFADGELAGAVAWYSLMYLAPDQRPTAYAEIARVLRPGGVFAMGFKMGDDSLRRGGQSVGVEFDIYWLSMDEVQRRLVEAGFRVVFWGGRPGLAIEPQPQGYVVAELT